MLSLLQAEEIKNAVVEYLKATYNFDDKTVEQAFEDFLYNKRHGMFKGPYIQIRLPFERIDHDVNLGDVASIVLEGMVKRNPHWVAKLPGGDALAGLIAKEATENGTAEVIENEVVFKKKTPADEGMSEEMKAQMGFLKQLESHFNQEQLDKIMLILESFTEKPKNIETVFELLEIKIENEKV